VCALYLGFVVRHVVKKLMVVGTLVAGAVLLTKPGRKAAKVMGAAIAGGTKAAIEAAKEQPDSDGK
jgi:hypothetical protein